MKFVLYIQGSNINYILISRAGFTHSLIFQAQGSLPEVTNGEGGGRSNLNVEVFNVEKDRAVFIINE